ncbi:FRG domain-containing protein [Parasphingorhabdus halotolerans]|uniref:FRG domain-containing protein n=1 Tax=Parasphingorhabdus halotolerans TaxID=2725558 RepID=UPI001B39EAC3|nr:FRG domain-containing protein [Parasphingorhabdus halotolerans]
MADLSKLTIAGCGFETDVSGQKVFHVNSPHALMQAIGYLKHISEPWERIFVRGQRKLYGSMRPTLYRGISSNTAQDKRHRKLSKVIEDFSASSKLFKSIPDYAQEPLLQHYGIQTTWLDMVDNVWVALWFAVHRAQSTGLENQYMHFDARNSSDDGEFAYILLIRTDDSRKERVKKGIAKGKLTETVDLRIAAPSVFLRPHAQHGLLFRARGTEGGRLVDYSDLVAGVLRFSLEHGKAWLGSGAMHTVRSLFPPPFFDDGYKILLGVEHSEKTVGLITHVGA